MEEMKKYILGDVCSRLSSGKGISSEEVLEKGPFPVIGGNGLRGYAFKSNFTGECGVIGRQGAYCGNVRFFSGEAYMTEHAVVVVGNELADTRYLTFLLSTMHLGSLSAQSAQPGLSVKTLAKQEILLPPLPEQKRRASILASLEEKIALNTRINHNLEEQAQALYKSWFIDFEPFRDGKFVDSELGMIPEGWHVGKLSELLEIRYGKDHKALRDGQTPVYGSGGLMRYAEKALYEGESVLIPRKGTLNNVMYVNGPFWTVDTMFYTMERASCAIKYCHLFLLTKDLASMNAGSAVPSMTTDILNNLPLLIPSYYTLDAFNRVVSSIYEVSSQREKESVSLSQFRNTILPQLMFDPLLMHN